MFFFHFEQVPIVGQPVTLPDFLEKVGIRFLVSFISLPFSPSPPPLSLSLSQMYFGTQHARIYIFSNLLGTNCLTGMSCMVRKSVLDNAGGLEAFSVYLAEDYFIGKTVIDRCSVVE